MWLLCDTSFFFYLEFNILSIYDEKKVYDPIKKEERKIEMTLKILEIRQYIQKIDAPCFPSFKNYTSFVSNNFSLVAWFRSYFSCANHAILLITRHIITQYVQFPIFI